MSKLVVPKQKERQWPWRNMPNAKGPRYSIRWTLASVVCPLFNYNIMKPTWKRALRYGYYREMLEKTQRMALTTCTAFKTISTDAALVISALPQIHIRAEGMAIHQTELEKIKSMGSGSRSGNKILEKKPGPYKVLIKVWVSWDGRMHGEMEYYLTQIRSGHDWLGLALFFECDEWRGARETVSSQVGKTIDPIKCLAL